MRELIKIVFLEDHRHMIPVLVNYFEAEWSGYYGTEGPGDALSDITSLCNKSKLPICLIALKQNSFCGSVALRKKSASHQHLGPWVTSLFVVPENRRQGVGTCLINAAVRLSMEMGHSTIYARSATAIDIFKNNKWIPFDWIDQDQLTIFKKDLKP